MCAEIFSGWWLLAGEEGGGDGRGCAEPLDAEFGHSAGFGEAGSGFQYFFQKLHGHTKQDGQPGNGDGFAYAALELLAAADADGSGTLSSGELAAAPGAVRDFCDATLRAPDRVGWIHGPALWTEHWPSVDRSMRLACNGTGADSARCLPWAETCSRGRVVGTPGGFMSGWR